MYGPGFGSQGEGGGTGREYENGNANSKWHKLIPYSYMDPWDMIVFQDGAWTTSRSINNLRVIPVTVCPQVPYMRFWA